MKQIDFTRQRITHWDEVAKKWGNRIGLGRYYHRRMTKIYRFFIARDLKILELGCGQGDLLAALHPSRGVGIDFSPEMIARAQSKHSGLQFLCSDAADFDLQEKFDVIILSDLINDLWDVQQVLQIAARHATERTRIFINFYNRIWDKPLRLSQKLRLSKSTQHQNWLAPEDVLNLFELTDLQLIRRWVDFLFPLYLPLISSFSNRFLAKLWPFRLMALAHFFVARKKPEPTSPAPTETVSVIIAARNEAGNIGEIFSRVPEMGKWTELIFIEGHSSDDTYTAIEKEIARHPQRRASLFRQPGTGKGDAVRIGFEKSSGDILMVLDADLTVIPEDLPRFYQALASGKGEFINGVRLVYPMEKHAMRFINQIGNKFFSLAFTWLLGQPIKDTLCGTKVLHRSDYLQIQKNRSCFGDFDPFGDFDLIFGATKQNLKMIDLPIRYRDRTYGKTNIQRWKHGWLLLRMVLFAAGRIKFI